jgi:hypothetical protein
MIRIFALPSGRFKDVSDAAGHSMAMLGNTSGERALSIGFDGHVLPGLMRG